ncbi:hypothetical protein Ssi03_62460 [Sphaerisporangium siamense]|uniref:Uncharacterized protein n=1 Tax=Sphaerisporangium siamense TaxID=795645 RepID=A0A7W7D9M2_9ACTN|nr:hypothetical protein [Sphaerisporangium siamense]MBB4702556.1 hypothetical protein [Sphaerisporangium siamense]GII88256.1 hypothetical protein Ssi03_62460 [Sphaerisporangium siamense]
MRPDPALDDDILPDWRGSSDAARWTPPPREEWEELRPLLIRRVVDALGLDEQTAGEQLDDIHARDGESPYIELIVRLAATLPVNGPNVQAVINHIDRVACAPEERLLAIAELGRAVAPAVAQFVLAEQHPHGGQGRGIEDR